MPYPVMLTAPTGRRSSPVGPAHLALLRNAALLP